MCVQEDSGLLLHKQADCDPYNSYSWLQRLGFIAVLALEIYGYMLAIYYKSVFPSCTFSYCFAGAFFIYDGITATFLQLEDDIVVKQNYFSTIKNFALQLASEDWMILEFSQLGFIGKKMFILVVERTHSSSDSVN